MGAPGVVGADGAAGVAAVLGVPLLEEGGCESPQPQRTKAAQAAPRIVKLRVIIGANSSPVWFSCKSATWNRRCFGSKPGECETFWRFVIELLT